MTSLYDRVLEWIVDYADRRWTKQKVKRREARRRARLERLIEMSMDENSLDWDVLRDL